MNAAKTQAVEEEMQRSRPETWVHDPLFNIVLYEPEIPCNTGTIGRTCLGVGGKLWLVRPLGFQITDHQLKRAGLDYWPHLDWEAVDHWDHFLRRFSESLQDLNKELKERQEAQRDPRFWFFTKKAAHLYYNIEYHRGDVFVYGRESVGLAPEILEKYAENTVRIPTLNTIRSLNQSVSVGISIFEAKRQLEMKE
ncbi:MAG: tRNA (cytidine(34)-2'-O)-methyltransferase [Planctomycetia bacterium]|nr:tRNA (cytidine(34)-2'-O)-methyltransferase [Planctomycetia bacterium]